MSNNVVIDTINLSKSFNKLLAVNRLSFTVNANDIYGFLGPNGSGKSTTIRMMLSLLKPDNGEVIIFGKSLKNKRKEILSAIGSFIEKPDFYEYLSALKNLELLSVYSGIEVNKNKIYEILELVGLKDRAKSKVKTFSKGMKQRLGIAQALLHDPELLILDEPASGLDPSGNKDIRNLITYLNKEKNKTIILSSHNLQEIETIANRMLIINNGKKVVEGEVEKLLMEHSYFTRISIDEPNKALETLQNSSLIIESLEVEDRLLKINCTKHEIPKINEYLVLKGFAIESIKVEQNLEDYFLKIT